MYIVGDLYTQSGCEDLPLCSRSRHSLVHLIVVGAKFADQMIELISLFILDVQSGFVNELHNDVRIGTLISSYRICHLVTSLSS